MHGGEDERCFLKIASNGLWSLVTPIDNYVVGNTCDTREVTECLVNLLLKDVLGTDEAEREPQESVSPMR